MSGSDDSSGMNTLDLLGASRGARYIVRLMLRKKQATYSELRGQIDLSEEDLEEGIEEMLARGWLYVQEVEGEKVYSLEIQKKEGSEVTRKGREPSASSKMAELWDKVDGGTTGTEEGRDAQREMTSFHREKHTGLDALDEMAADAGAGASMSPEITAVEPTDAASGDTVKPLMSASPVSQPMSQNEPAKAHSDESSGQPQEEPGGLLGLIRRWFKK